MGYLDPPKHANAEWEKLKQWAAPETAIKQGHIIESQNIPSWEEPARIMEFSSSQTKLNPDKYGKTLWKTEVKQNNHLSLEQHQGVATTESRWDLNLCPQLQDISVTELQRVPGLCMNREKVCKEQPWSHRAEKGWHSQGGLLQLGNMDCKSLHNPLLTNTMSHQDTAGKPAWAQGSCWSSFQNTLGVPYL